MHPKLPESVSYGPQRFYGIPFYRGVSILVIHTLKCPKVLFIERYQMRKNIKAVLRVMLEFSNSLLALSLDLALELKRRTS